jgi:predicted ATPase
VGRGAELERLRELMRAVCQGVRQLAFVVGEPGIGKSTLIEMFLERARGGQVRIGRGQCLDQRGAGEPYMPVLEALGRLCREREGAELLAVLERYAPTWLAQMPSLLDAAQLEAVQRRAFGATRDRMLREMVEALDAFTVDAPLLLLLEDLHWSDPSTLDLLMALALRPEPAQLLVLGTYRPGDAPDGLAGLVRTLRSQGRCAEIALGVWTEADTRAYLAARCAPGALPPGVVDLVLRRTDGHPLFVRSLMDEWQETGALVRDGAEWRLGGDLDQLARTVPESLRASIEQRIDGLSPAHQELLEAASVAGAEFEVAAVGAALDREDRLMRPLLTRQGWPGHVRDDGGPTDADAPCLHHLTELLYARLALATRGCTSGSGAGRVGVRGRRRGRAGGWPALLAGPRRRADGPHLRHAMEHATGRNACLGDRAPPPHSRSCSGGPSFRTPAGSSWSSSACSDRRCW